MSAASKGIILRLIMPKDSATRILATLGPAAKAESKELTLGVQKLTTDEIVGFIRDYTHLRDELLHSLRQYPVQRNPKHTSLAPVDFSWLLGSARKGLDATRTRFQELQSKIESFERQVEETRKQASILEGITGAGFTTREVLSEGGEFKRIIGYLPARKLEDAERSLRSTLKDQVALSVGNRAKDRVYILLAVSPEKISLALQTLLLYDFIPSDIPSPQDVDLEKGLATLEDKKKRLQNELDNSKSQMEQFREEVRDNLNELADKVQDSLITLKAILKMGEGSNASQALVWLPKAPSPKTLNALRDLGALFEAE